MSPRFLAPMLIAFPKFFSCPLMDSSSVSYGSGKILCFVFKKQDLSTILLIPKQSRSQEMMICQLWCSNLRPLIPDPSLLQESSMKFSCDWKLFSSQSWEMWYVTTHLAIKQALSSRMETPARAHTNAWEEKHPLSGEIHKPCQSSLSQLWKR